MRLRTSSPVLMAMLLAIGFAGEASACYCGAASFKRCASACSTPSEVCAPPVRMVTCYKTVQETVWEPETYTCKKTVYDTVCEPVPQQCTKTVYDTCYTEEPYTICRPVYTTQYREEQYTVCRPVYQTTYREEQYTV